MWPICVGRSKPPSLARAYERLAEQARAEEWSHEEFLAACLEREVAARQTNGGELRIKAARFPARKTIEDFDFSFQRSLKRDTMLHLGTLDFVAARDNVVFLGPARNRQNPFGHRIGDQSLPRRVSGGFRHRF